MVRPYWSGQFQISLVSFGIQLLPATEAKSEIRFHQLNRRTGERVKHQNVAGDEADPVTKDDIVKGYEYTKGEYVMIEPEEIDNLRIPSRQTLEVTQFVDRDEVDPEFFEKPYFVVPQNSTQAEAFAVVRKAMQSTRKLALGKIAFGGREHLIAVSAPEGDEHLGMMAYTMRYAEEVRKPEEYFGEIKKVAVHEDQLALAKELIQRKVAKFDPEKFTDEYESALREMVEAKVKHAPLPKSAPAPKPTNVVNLMDALRKSVQSNRAEIAPQDTARSSSGQSKSKKMALVAPSEKKTAPAAKKPKKLSTKRRSA